MKRRIWGPVKRCGGLDKGCDDEGKLIGRCYGLSLYVGERRGGMGRRVEGERGEGFRASKHG